MSWHPQPKNKHIMYTIHSNLLPLVNQIICCLSDLYFSNLYTLQELLVEVISELKVCFTQSNCSGQTVKEKITTGCEKYGNLI